MIIDVSNTVGKHRFKPEIKAESLLPQMDAAGVDMAVINCYAESLDNASVEEACRLHPDRFIGLYTVNPWREDAPAELEDALKNRGFRGLYMNPLRHGYILCEHQVFYPLLDVCKSTACPSGATARQRSFPAPSSLGASQKTIPT